MDHEILVKEIKKAIKIIKKKSGNVALIMLKTSDAHIPIWNLIISASEYDYKADEETVKEILTILNKTVEHDILKQIIRITILKTDDPFVKGVNRLFRVKNSTKYIQSVVISGIEIDSGIIFESASLNAGHKRQINRNSELRLS